MKTTTEFRQGNVQRVVNVCRVKRLPKVVKGWEKLWCTNCQSMVQVLLHLEALLVCLLFPNCERHLLGKTTDEAQTVTSQTG